jgi:hypothetical protein
MVDGWDGARGGLSTRVSHLCMVIMSRHLKCVLIGCKPYEINGLHQDHLHFHAPANIFHLPILRRTLKQHVWHRKNSSYCWRHR